MKAEQVPDEVRAVFKAACDSGKPLDVNDTIAAITKENGDASLD